MSAGPRLANFDQLNKIAATASPGYRIETAAKVSMVAFGTAWSRTSRPTDLIAWPRTAVDDLDVTAAGKRPRLVSAVLTQFALHPCTVLVPFFRSVPRLYRDNLIRNAPVCDDLHSSPHRDVRYSHRTSLLFGEISVSILTRWKSLVRVQCRPLTVNSRRNLELDYLPTVGSAA